MFNTSTVGTFVAVIGLLLTLVALFASYRVSQRGVSSQVYRDTASAWEAKSKAQDAEIAGLRAELGARDQAVADLTGQVAVLRDTVTGARAWDTLERRTAEMLSLAAESRSEARQIHEGVLANLAQLRDLQDSCGQVMTAVAGRLGGKEGDTA